MEHHILGPEDHLVYHCDTSRPASIPVHGENYLFMGCYILIDRKNDISCVAEQSGLPGVPKYYTLARHTRRV